MYGYFGKTKIEVGYSLGEIVSHGWSSVVGHRVKFYYLE